MLRSVVRNLTFHLRKTVFRGWQFSSAVRRFAFRRLTCWFALPTNCFHCQTYYFAQSEMLRSAFAFYRKICYFPQDNVSPMSDILFTIVRHVSVCRLTSYISVHHYLFSSIRHAAFRCHTYCFPLSHILLSAVRHVAFRCQTCCFPLSNMSLSAVKHVAFRWQTCRFPLSNMSLSAVKHVAFRCRHMAFHRLICCLPPSWLATLRSWRKILFYYICTQTTELTQLLTFSRVSSLCYLVSVFIIPFSVIKTQIGRFSKKKYK
jgi:hypothetical protein